MADGYSLKGFNVSPLEGDKVLQFMNKVEDISRKRKREYEDIQAWIFEFVYLVSILIAQLLGRD
jgi:hypothetical protein